MNYKVRFAENKIREFAKYYKVILILGARQVGKTTLLTNLLKDVRHITFDPVQDLYGAKNDPDLFLDNFPAPLILDEIQFVPGLIAAIKRKVDTTETKGMYYLTGSHNLSVLRNISESMAGRVGVIHLDAMLPSEMYGYGNAPQNWLQTLLKAPDSLPGTIRVLPDKETGLYRTIWRGNMPGLLDFPDDMVSHYFSSYVQTYIERDVRLIENIRELDNFGRFIRIAAALTGQEMNYNHIGREIGVSPETAKRWLGLLKYGFQWRELPPFLGNSIKRISQKSKGFFTDTGLACYLQSLTSYEALPGSPLFGALFETFGVNLVSRQLSRFASGVQMYHWRTNGGAEIDIILDHNGRLIPIEIKGKSNLSGHDIRGIRSFRETYSGKCDIGAILYAGKECYRINETTWAIPWQAM